MAEGYTRNSGRLEVCCSTSDQEATNLIKGVASAYENKVPLLVIAAQTSLKNFGGRAFQESVDTGINIVGAFRFCTGFYFNRIGCSMSDNWVSYTSLQFSKQSLLPHL